MIISLLLIMVLAPLWMVDLVFLVEILLGLAAPRARRAPTYPSRIAILTPAHNEARAIRGSVEAIGQVLPPGARHLVIAHNCSDTTAEEARIAGAEVAVLDQPDQRGKGYALAFGRERLAADPPDVVIVIDADCAIEAGSIAHLASVVTTRGRAVQGCYLFRSRRGDPPVVQISNFAMLVKNLVRQRGGARIGAPALMTGSGMAFPWHQFARLDLATGNIVEDLAIGIELIEAGVPPLFNEHARIWSLPSSVLGTQTQRSRWEGGFMTTARLIGPALIGAGLRHRSWSKLWMGLHLLVPPLTLVLLANMMAWLVLAVIRLTGGPSLAFGISSALLAAILLAVLAAWAMTGRAVLTIGALLRLPFYLIWKLALYARLCRREGQAAWVRTERID